MATTWRFRARDPRGLNARDYPVDLLRIDGAFNAKRDGNGDCTECTFSGDVDLHPRESLEIQESTDGFLTWRNIWSGVMVQSKSRYGPLGSYKAAGHMKRLGEVEVRLTLQQADLYAQVQQMMADVLGSGQLGNLINLAVVFPAASSGVTSLPLIPNYQHADAVLKTLAGRKQDVVVGVNADRQVFFGPPDRTPLLLDEATPGVHTEWQDVSSEELVTHLRLLWPRPMGGTQLTYSAAPVARGHSPATVQNAQSAVSSELLACPGIVDTPVGVIVPLGVVAGSDAPNYGESVTTLGVILDSSNFRRVTETVVTFSATSYTVANGQQPGNYTYSGDESALYDADRGTALTLVPDPVNHGYSGMQAQFAYPVQDGVPIGFEFVADNATLTRVSIGDGQAQFACTAPSGSSGYYLIPDEARTVLAGSVGSKAWIVTYQMQVTDYTANVVFRAAALLFVSPTFSQPLAAAVLRLPVVAAAVVTVSDWIDPKPYVNLQRRSRAGDPLDLVTLPASYEYVVSQAGTPQTLVKLGQRDSPAVTAAWALIKERDKAAALNAVLVSTST